MRPLLVLVIVIGAIGALMFVLFNWNAEPTAPGGTVATEVLESAPAPGRPAELARDPNDSGREVAPAGDPNRVIASDNPTQAFVYDNALTGLVKKPDGEPLADVEVTMTTFGGTDIFFANDPVDRSGDVTVRTDTEGRFTFRRIAPRNHYQLIAVHPDYTRKEVTSVPVGQQGTFEEPPILLSEGATLRGRVRDVQNNYVNDATLQLEGLVYQAAPYAAPDRMETKTDNEGWYTFTNVPKGQRTLTVTAPGYGRQTITGLAFDKDEIVTRDLTLQIGEMMRGRVVGTDSAGLAGATVSALGFSNTQQTARSVATTDERGEFFFEDLSPGQYNVVAQLKGWRCERAQRVQSNSDNVVIEMFKEASVCGVVAGADGQPVPAFTIRLRHHYGTDVPSSPSEISQSFTSPKGDFCVEGVPQGQYVAEAQAPGYSPSFSSEFVVQPGRSVQGITIRMNMGGSLSGRIVDPDGKPIAQARVSTHDKEWSDDEFTRMLGASYPTNATSAEARTAADGTFHIRNLNPETYQVQIQAPGYTSLAKMGVVVDTGETKLGDVRLGRGGSLRGTLFDPSGKGLVGGQIHMRSADGSSTYTYQTKSGGEGKFVITNIVPGRYIVTATRTVAGEGNPFEQLSDIKNSERQVSIVESTESVQDLTIAQ